MKTKIFTIVLLFLYSFANCQDINGSWMGELDVQGTKLPLIINIKKDGNDYKTTFDSPKQGAKDIPVAKTTYNNNELLLEAPNMGISYTGKYTNEKIEGIFKQSNMELPLHLVRNTADNAFVLNRPQTPKAPFNYNTEEVTFENSTDKNTLAGTITTPKDKKNFPIVVMITGSGSQNRDEELFGHKPFAVIADDFAKKGIATLRLDDRGIGGSSKGSENPTTASFATDINATVAFLTQKGYTNIGLLGHSEGGMIAPMVAATNKKVKFIISMAGPATKIEDLLCMQIEKGGLLSGEKPEKVKLDVATSRKVYDLIREQILVAAGVPISGKNYFPNMHAIECRINAEDPYNDFRPSPGKITVLHSPGGHGVRLDTHVYAGYTIPPNYDSMIAKLITTAQTRQEAINKMKRALDEFVIEGIKTTIPFHRQLMDEPGYVSGNYTTAFMDTFKMKERT